MAKKQVTVSFPNDHWHTIADSDIINGCGIINGKLTISFHKKTKYSFTYTGTYQYETQDLTLCDQMAASASKGQFFHQHIRSLNYQRLH